MKEPQPNENLTPEELLVYWMKKQKSLVETNEVFHHLAGLAFMIFVGLGFSSFVFFMLSRPSQGVGLLVACLAAFACFRWSMQAEDEIKEQAFKASAAVTATKALIAMREGAK